MSLHRLLLPLAFAALPLVASGQTQPGIRTLATFTDRFTTDPHVSPDGRFVLLPMHTELRVYNVATKKSVKIADGAANGLEWSRRVDRIAWVRRGDDGKGLYVWTMAMDPATGAPKGPAQRVSATQGHHPAISVDGKWIAFQTPESATADADRENQPQRLAIVPVTGGPERTVGHLREAAESEFWSADGKSIYIAGSAVGSPKAVVTKLFVDGRAPEVIRGDSAEWAPGITADRRFLVTVPARNPISAKDRAVVMDTAGREVGRVPLPVGTTNEYDHPIDSSLVWVAAADNRRLEMRSLDGSPRRLNTPLPAENPAWSPDGKRIAFQVREDAHSRLAFMNADGSGVQVLRQTDLRADQWAIRWSPDSKSIAFESADWHSLVLFDVASSKVRPIVTDTTHRIGLWIWRADGQSIAAVILGQSSPQTANIEEVRLDGGRRSLLELTPRLPKNTGFQFIDGNNVVLREDSAVFVAPLGGGAPRRVAAGLPGTRTNFVAVSHDGRTFAGLLYNPAQSKYNQIDVLSLDSGQRRILEVPFEWAGGSQPIFSPDDRTVLVVGRRSGDTTSAHVYAVPMNGDTPKEVATVGNAGGAAVSASPDGKSIVYSVQDVRTTSLLLVDLRSVMKGDAVQTGRARKP